MSLLPVVVWILLTVCLSPLHVLVLPVGVCVLLVLFGSVTCCVCPFCVVWVHYLLCVPFLYCLGPLPVVSVCPFCVVWVRYLFLFGVMLASFQTLQPLNKLQPEKYSIIYLLFCGFGTNICT